MARQLLKSERQNAPTAGGFADGKAAAIIGCSAICSSMMEVPALALALLAAGGVEAVQGEHAGETGFGMSGL